MPIVQLLDGEDVLEDVVLFDDAFWAASEQEIRQVTARDGAWALVVVPDARDAGAPVESMRRLDSMGALENWLAALPS